MFFFERNGVIWTIVIIGVLFCGICLGLLIEGKEHFLPTLSGFATAFGTLLLGVAAIKGVNQWKSEIRGRTEFEAAKNYLCAAYRVKKELDAFRSPMILASEFPDGYSPLRADSQQRSDAFAHAYNKRWSYIADAFLNFETASLDAEVLWGQQVSSLTTSLKGCVTRLNTSVQAEIRNIASDGKNFMASPELRERVTKDISYAGEDEADNELESRINEVMRDIKEFTKAHLSTLGSA